MQEEEDSKIVHHLFKTQKLRFGKWCSSWRNSRACRHSEDASPHCYGKYLRESTEAARWRQISVACHNWTAAMTAWNSSIYHSAMSQLISQALRLLDRVMKNEGGKKWCILLFCVANNKSATAIQTTPRQVYPWFTSFPHSLQPCSYSSQSLFVFLCTSISNYLTLA